MLSLPTYYQQVTNTSLAVHQLLADSQATVDWKMAYKQLSFQQIVNKAVGQQLANCPPTVGRQLTDSRPTVR